MSIERVTRFTRTVFQEVTRPADTNAYTAGDVISDSTSAPTVITFGNVARESGGNGTIVHAVCVDSANVATKPDLELWLFDTTVTPDNDNAAFTPTDAELKTLVGVIAFPTASFKAGDATSGAGGNSICEATSLNIAFKAAGATNSALYGVLVVRNAYVPVSAESFFFRLKILD